MAGGQSILSRGLWLVVLISAALVTTVAWLLDTSNVSPWTLVAVGFVPAVIVGLWSRYRYQKPLETLDRTAQAVINGEAPANNRPDSPSPDTIAGQLGDYGRQTLARGARLADYCDRLAIGAAEVSFFIDQLKSGVSRDRNSTEEVSGAVAEIRDGTEAITRSANDTARVANETSKMATEGETIIENAINKIRDVADQVEHTAASMARLQEASERIQGITTVINEVADQTNLLALNAAIEAARAGEHGRGFAVVAEEVRELAKKTTQATDEIADVLQTIQDESQNSASVMSELRARVTETVEVSGTVAETLRSIVQQAHQSDTGVQQIAENMGQHLEAAGRINTAVVDLNERLQHTESDSEQSSARALHLSEIAENMSLELAQVKLTPHHEQIRKIAQESAAAIGKTFEAAIAEGQLSEADVFDTNYQPVPNTDPPKFKTRYDDFTDRAFPAIQEAILDANPQIVYAGAVDYKGYFPTHNKRYSQPLTGDYKTDFAKNRTKRIFDDRTGSRCGSHTQAFLLQTYKRDTGEILHDMSAPIYVNGRHWGGFRIGYKAQEPSSGQN